VEGRDSGPRGLILATLDADRATFDLAPILGGTWTDAGDEPVLGGRCRVAELGEARLVLAEPTTEGSLAACLARFGEGPVALAIDGRTDAGREVASNPLNGGPARWIRLGQGTAPYLLVVLAR
jgi:hypothetical protein